MISTYDQKGALSSAKNGQISGWANDNLQNSEQSEIEIYAKGILLGRCLIGGKDINKIQRVNGDHGFLLNIESVPPQLSPPYVIRAQFASNKSMLDGEIFIENIDQHEEALCSAAGEVIGLKDGAIEGWALSKTNISEILQIEILHNDIVIGMVNANLVEPVSPRFGSGHGFKFPLPAQLLNGAVHSIKFRILSTKYELKGSPFSITLVAVQDILSRLLSVEASLKDLRNNYEQERLTFTKSVYQSLGFDLAKRMDAVALLQRDAFERELIGIRSNLGMDKSENKMTTDLKTKSVDQDFKEPIVGYGWYNAEQSVTGDYFRWMSQSSVVIIDFKSKYAARINVKVLMSLDESHLTEISLSLNGIKIDYRVVPSVNGWLIEGEVPVQAFMQAPYAAVMLAANFARQPSKDDARKLSIAVSSISIESI